MGTRYEDQPPEHWAGPESLDPTPVWRQFLVFGILALSALGIIAVVSYLALAPLFVTPPALLPGGRLVLSREQTAPPGPVRVVLESGGPIVEGEMVRTADGIEFREIPWAPGQVYLWVFPIAGDDYIAVSGSWQHPDTGESCRVGATLGSIRALTDPAIPAFRADCGAPLGGRGSSVFTFGARGQPLDAPRGLDRYLVSALGDRVIVNLSREIRGFGATPQPLVSPLATPVQTRRP